MSRTRRNSRPRRRWLLPQPAAQEGAAGLLATVLVDGQPPGTVEQLDAALEYLESEVVDLLDLAPTLVQTTLAGLACGQLC
ncbi:MAG: hypothetical protein JXA67_22590 [Micromonosporaceae bacterium]|nr:hypothetical protein [Micromonosporaceae bacterium]